MTVPRSLRAWFVVHFWADVLFAAPLFFAPQQFLGLLGIIPATAAPARRLVHNAFALVISRAAAVTARSNPRPT